MSGENLLFVCLGATGEWSGKTIGPAFIELKAKGLLTNETRFVGISRKIKRKDGTESISRDDFLEFVITSLPENIDSEAEDFVKKSFYYYSADAGDPRSWSGIRSFCDKLCETHTKPYRRVVLLSTHPGLVPPILTGIKESGFTSEGDRLILEKPFGHDAASCRSVFGNTQELFGGNVFPIDHYRGKLGTERFVDRRLNDIAFNDNYNADSITSITILAHESDCVTKRHKTYLDIGGVGPDMFQTHLLPLALLMAQPRESLHENASRDSVKAAQLQCLSGISITDCVWGQYEGGHLPNDPSSAVTGFRELSVDKAYSKIPTFCSFKVMFKYGPLAGVPIFIETGKGLPKKHTEIIMKRKGIDEPYRFILHETVKDQTVQIPVCKDDLGLSTYSKLLHSAITDNWPYFLSTEVLVSIWEAVEPVYDAFKVGVESDLEKPKAQRQLLLPYEFGKMPYFVLK